MTNTIAELLKDSAYKLSQFKPEQIEALEAGISLKGKTTTPYILVELKKPKLKDGKEQLKSYCNATDAPMGVWTNDEQISYYHRNLKFLPNRNKFKFLIRTPLCPVFFQH